MLLHASPFSPKELNGLTDKAKRAWASDITIVVACCCERLPEQVPDYMADKAKHTWLSNLPTLYYLLLPIPRLYG